MVRPGRGPTKQIYADEKIPRVLDR